MATLSLEEFTALPEEAPVSSPKVLSLEQFQNLPDTQEPLDVSNIDLPKLDSDRTGLFERLGKGYGTGIAGMVEGIGGVAKWFVGS